MIGHPQLCTFYLDGLFFGIDVQLVQEVIRPQRATRVPLAPRCVTGLINLRGQIVTGIDLRRRLALAERPEDQPPMNVVLRRPDGAVSLLVDEIGDVQTVAPESFEPPPETLPARLRNLLQGVYKLPDRLLIVLDPERVLDLSGDPVGG